LDAEDGVLGFERVCSAVQAGRLKYQFQRLVLAGFSELSPRMAALIEAFRVQGVALCELQLNAPQANSISRVQAPDPDAEWRLAARWAKKNLSLQPEGRFAIVAAQLESDVALAHRVLREALGDAQGRPEFSYNIAVARPLSKWPLVRAALAWLNLMAQMLRHRQCTPADAGAALLAGACVADTDEAGGRARIDARLRADAVVNLPLGEFSRRLAPLAPALAKAWVECIEQAMANASRTTIDVWVARFKRWLQLLGFPGQAALDTHVYQTVDAFQRMLESLSRQSLVLGPLGFGEAVSELSSLAAQTPFQPQRDPTARLDVQGFLETEGGRWDAVWVLGLTDEVLPAAARPNPLLPLSALRRADAPRATPERELHWAKSMFEALLRTAPKVWLSHALQEGERELRPSPFIAAFNAEAPMPDLRAIEPVAMERVIDDQGPPLPQGAVTKGGIAVIDTQARNPLWAFAKYRLGASQLPDYAELADQNARGVFLHKCMELIYKQVPDSESLHQWRTDGGLSDMIDDALQRAADECLADYGNTVRELEIQRSEAILQDWFALELTRGRFSVKAIEETYPWSHGPLQLSLRLDRVDVLADGALAVIDYKTGAGPIDPKPDWMRERPVGLQLPFYAAVLADGSDQVGALLLARLHARGIELKGLSDGDCGVTGPAVLSDWPDFQHLDWEGLMSQWRETIRRLADEYAEGVAVNTSLRSTDLAYCDVLPFLRLNQEDGHVD
ncbi:MAG TPA: PD-(D/E)XK nuclease family protein, partial [Pusillimonas sp.]|uniref:PD-(D/E)XK nuclease family protein n=1 Tax=Pusillimonas sp. TaxID=3040095 RepID=UPI002BEADD9D